MQRQASIFTPPPLQMACTQPNDTAALPRALETERHDHTVTNHGLVFRMFLPLHWSLNSRALNPSGSNLTVFSKSAEARYHIKSSIRKVSPESVVASVHSLLAEKSVQLGPQVLLPNEIRRIQFALGAMGYNQFTCAQPKSFHLRHAAVVRIESKAILEIHGDFLDRNQIAVSEYRGILAFAKNQVHEICLEGAPSQFPHFVKAFTDMVRSISWRNDFA